MLVKDRIIDFLWQHILLLVSLFLLAFGVALCVRSNLGSSVISSAPYAFTLAGQNLQVPAWSLGMYTNILNVLLVVGQILVLGRKFRLIQLLQLLIGTIFGVFIDTSMLLTSFILTDNVLLLLFIILAGCSVMAVGVAMEIRCASITMPGEGLPAALSKRTGKPFSTMKIYVDLSLAAIAITAMLVFFHRWCWNIVGIGTLFATIYCGRAVRFISNRLDWFDRLLGYHPGFRRYFYGLAQYVQSYFNSRNDYRNRE